MLMGATEKRRKGVTNEKSRICAIYHNTGDRGQLITPPMCFPVKKYLSPITAQIPAPNVPLKTIIFITRRSCETRVFSSDCKLVETLADFQ